jgi:environmental stress-induced protein Ves
VRIVPRAAFVERPWRNGGGVSWEALAHPDGDWAINLAEIARDGPFSDWSGFDRTLTPVRGEGLALNGIEIARPHGFDGGLPVHATVAAGPVLVFNVLSRRGAWRHAVRRTEASEGSHALCLATLDLLVREAGDAPMAGAGGFLSVTLEPA